MLETTIIGILFTIIVGILLHYTYEWSGYNDKVALFSAVNESTWEHLKLLFFPYLIYTVFEYYYIGNEYSNYFTAKGVGIIFGLIAIPLIFRAYTSVLGNHYLPLDILTFSLGVIIAYLVSYNILNNEEIEFNSIGFLILISLTLAFFVFTFYPPHTKIFLDPVTNTYGI